MNDEYDVKVWKYAITGFVVLVLAGIGSCQGTRYQKRMAVEAGASPMAAHCLIEWTSANGSCAIIAAAEAEALRNH